MTTHAVTAVRRLVFPGERAVTCDTCPATMVGPTQVRVRARWSLMSTGTETIVYGRKFDVGTHWDHWVRYPFFPGYALVGEIIERGDRVTGPALGDWVACRAPHASHVVLEAAECFVIPAGVDRRDACWFALAKIAAMGARAAPMQLADRVLVIGAGPIGQMSLRWARAAGAERLVVLDSVPWRLDLATQGGADATIAQPVESAAAQVLTAFGGRSPNLVIDATGHHQVLPHAMGLAGLRGTVLVIGDTGRPASQHLTSDLVTRGLRLVGAHDGNETADWNSPRIIPFFFTLVASGRFRLDGLTTHTFSPADCHAAYELAESRRGQTMGICFDWSAP